MTRRLMALVPASQLSGDLPRPRMCERLLTCRHLGAGLPSVTPRKSPPGKGKGVKNQVQTGVERLKRRLKTLQLEITNHISKITY